MISRIITLIFTMLILLITVFWSKEWMLLGLMALILLFLMIGFICNLIIARMTSCEIKVKNSTISGQPVVMSVDIHNKSIIPIFLAAIKINVINMNFGIETTEIKKISISGRENKNIEFDIDSKFCGKMFVSVKYVKIFDFWGICSKKILKNQMYETCMYPQYYSVSSISQVMRTNYEKERYFSHKKGDTLSEILQYREYQKGDSLKLINWKLSNKYDQMIIREFDTPTDNQLMIIFDTFEGDRIYKNLVYSVLSSISVSYAQNNITHYISWYNPVEKMIEHKNVEKFEDVFRYLRLIFETETEDDHISIGYLMERQIIEKYAKVIYITNKVTEGIKKELLIRPNIKTILVDSTTFNINKIREQINALDI